MYGLNENQRKITLKKIEDQKFFLDNNLLTFGDKTIALTDMVKNSFINSNRYIAEINNRVFSLYEYSKQRNLKNIFLTLTLPSEYHKKRTIKLKNGQKKLIRNNNFIDDEAHSPKQASKQLSKMFKRILDQRSYKQINRDDRVYFRVTEPHKDGTPHLHISLFIPDDKVDTIVNLIQNMYPSPLAKIETNVKNPVAYLMKYILKTFDDLRLKDSKLTDLTLWYIYHGISRIYTSRTLISLDVYRVLGGQFSLIELTKMYKDREITVWQEPQTNKLISIDLENMQIWQKKDYSTPNSTKPIKPTINKQKPIYTKKIPFYIDGKAYTYCDGQLYEKVNIPSKMSHNDLFNYYQNIDIEEVELPHFGLVQNECIKRNLIEGEIQSLDDFNTDWLREEDLNLRPSGYE
jgi:hypothetical protein